MSKIFDENLADILYDIFNHIQNSNPKVAEGKWYSGITGNIEKIENILGNMLNISFFKRWDVANKENAIVLENFLIEKGIDNGISISSLKRQVDDFNQNTSGAFIFVYNTVD